MDACINSNKAKLQHGKLHVYTFCKYFQAGQSEPAQKTVSTCLVYSHLSMTFGSPESAWHATIILSRNVNTLIILYMQMFKVTYQLTILLNQQVHIFVLSGIW